MSRKHIAIEVNDKDIENMMATLLTSILSRQVATIQQRTDTVSQGMQEKNPDKMLANLAVLLESFDETAKDLAYASIMIDTWRETLPPKTEVLENLPDLEEDGLGVDDRSEETVSLTPDHSEE